MTAPLISCIVPVFNGERYLREALDSILTQTYRPLEIVVADDGSTDGTRGIVASYGPVAHFVTQPTAGPPATRNLGLRDARGVFVAFLDADDLWHPDKLRRQMERFDARPELDVCVTQVQNFWMPGLEAEAARFQEHRLGGAVPGYLAMTLLARRALFDGVGPFDPALWHADSTEWFLRATERGAITELVPDVLVHHRMHGTNMSRRLATESRDEFLRVVKASLDRRRRREVAPGAVAPPR